MARELLEKINLHLFENIDFDEILDNREASDFDSEWIRVYSEVEELKKVKKYSVQAKESYDSICEKAYLAVYDLCGNSELAGYISDDFGLISDSEYTGYKDEWLNKLISCYQRSAIPCGKL